MTLIEQIKRGITPQELQQILRLETGTGMIFWKLRVPEMFPERTQGSVHSCAVWNAKYAHRPALNVIDNHGYRGGAIFGKNFKAHRVVFALHHGHWPNGCIDHINGDRQDNRPCNLRDVSRAENQRNMVHLSPGRSGRVGVNFHADTEKWCATIGDRGRCIHLGLFDRFEDAVEARVQAEADLNYSALHGTATGASQ